MPAERYGGGKNEDKEEMNIVPSAVSDAAGWYEPKFMFDRQCRKEGLRFYDIASIMKTTESRTQ